MGLTLPQHNENDNDIAKDATMKKRKSTAVGKPKMEGASKKPREGKRITSKSGTKKAPTMRQAAAEVEEQPTYSSWSSYPFASGPEPIPASLPFLPTTNVNVSSYASFNNYNFSMEEVFPSLHQFPYPSTIPSTSGLPQQQLLHPSFYGAGSYVPQHQATQYLYPEVMVAAPYSQFHLDGYHSMALEELSLLSSCYPQHYPQPQPQSMSCYPVHNTCNENAPTPAACSVPLLPDSNPPPTSFDLGNHRETTASCSPSPTPAMSPTPNKVNAVCEAREDKKKRAKSGEENSNSIQPKDGKPKKRSRTVTTRKSLAANSIAPDAYYLCRHADCNWVDQHGVRREFLTPAGRRKHERSAKHHRCTTQPVPSNGRTGAKVAGLKNCPIARGQQAAATQAEGNTGASLGHFTCMMDHGDQCLICLKRKGHFRGSYVEKPWKCRHLLCHQLFNSKSRRSQHELHEPHPGCTAMIASVLTPGAQLQCNSHSATSVAVSQAIAALDSEALAIAVANGCSRCRDSQALEARMLQKATM